MNVSDTMRTFWLRKLHQLRVNGYDPYNSLGVLRLGKISISWRNV